MHKKILIAGFCLLLPAAILWHFDAPIPSARSQKTTNKNSETQTNVNIENIKLENGVNLYYTQVEGLPLVRISLVFDAGRVRGDTNFSASDIVSAMMLEGSENISAQQIDEELQNIGASIQTFSGSDAAYISLNVLSENDSIEKSIKLLTKILKAPLFPEENMKRVVQNAQNDLENRMSLISEVAKKTFYEKAYPEHPYNRMQYDSVDSLKNLKQEELKNFYNTYYTQKSVNIIIVGNIEQKNAVKIGNAIADSLPTGQTLPVLPKANFLTENTVVHVPFESAQTHLLIGFPFIEVGSPEYPALWVANAAFGEVTLYNRLFTNIRDKQGLAYSIYSDISPRRDRGLFFINLQTRNEDAPKALALTIDTYENWVNKGITEAELQTAKQYIKGQYWQNLSTNSAIASEVSTLAFYGLPVIYPQTLMHKIDKLTVEEVNKTLKNVFNTQKMVILSAGPRPVQYG